MPDWSYHPALRPLLRFCRPERARDSILVLTGALASLPGGSRVFQALGGMNPEPENRVRVVGIEFPARVGLGAALDMNLVGCKAWPSFGFGFQEIGPVVLQADGTPGAVEMLANGGLRYVKPIRTLTAAAILRRVRAVAGSPCIVALRIGVTTGAMPEQAARDAATIIEMFGDSVHMFTVETHPLQAFDADDIEQYFATIVFQARKTPVKQSAVFVCISPDIARARKEMLLEIADRLGFDGVSISGGVHGPSDIRIGPDVRADSLQYVRELRERYGNRFAIIGSGGIHEPAHALAYFDAGASLVQIHSGFVAAGPLLPKRINRALFVPSPSAEGGRTIRRTAQICIFLFGAVLCIAACAIGYVALTSVVLPYDTAFCGVSRATLDAYNARLLPFMSHDRLTLAGVLLSIGILYIALAGKPIAQGRRWARTAFLASAGIGIASFFLWLGFRYFDPLHAILTLLLVPLFIAIIVCPMPPRQFGQTLDLHNDRAWERAHIGQFCFVVIGVGLMIGGAVIASVGVSNIFVSTDLVYLQTTGAELAAVNHNIIPLVAHDRAGFGGALFAYGLALTITILHGFERGEKWLWRTLCISGIPGFCATISIHFAIGYTTFMHLLPVYFAAALYIAGLAWTSAFLNDNKTSAAIPSHNDNIV